MEEINIEKENFINAKKEELDIKNDNDRSLRIAKWFKNTNNSSINLTEEFVKDFYKKYEQVDFFEYEDIETIKKDFATILEYDYSVSKEEEFYYLEEFEFSKIHKFKVKNKEGYLGELEYNESTGNYYVVHKNLNLFFKLNVDNRLHIETISDMLNRKKNVYEEAFLDAKEYVTKYDKENSKELKENLSEEFYFQRFSINSDLKLLEIDNNIKQKLLEIYNNHNVDFYVALKDNLLRIELEIPNSSTKDKIEILYNLEKTFNEIFEIFLEIERVNDNIRLNNIKEDYSGVKNIILDLDNTIIFDTEEDSETYRNVLIDAGYSDDYFYGIYQAIDYYDKSITENNPYYNEKDMLEFINESLEQDFSMELIDGIKDVVGKEWIKRVLISEDTLKYLASKYNLYIYTNYFQEVQTERIKNIGYLDYFKKVFGADKYGCKQYKKCFEKVLEEINAKPEECLMVGDDKSRDIMAANNVNMKSVLFDYNGRRDKREIEATNYIIIKNMDELERIL